MARTRPWKVSDTLREQVAPLIPPAPSHAKGGRPLLSDRQAFEAMVYVLRTGIQWNALPCELGASSTIHDRFEQWEQAGFFKALWEAGLAAYDDLVGIQWKWQAMDGAMTKAPDLWRRDRSQSHRSPQERNQAEPADRWGWDSPGTDHRWGQSS